MVEYLEKINSDEILKKINKLSEKLSKSNLIKIRFFLQELLEREGIA